MQLVAPKRQEDHRALRGAVAASFFLALTAAVAVVVSQSGGKPVEMDQQEIMKPWADGMYPADAEFPPGYNFGDNNVFGKRDTFGAGDIFGENNVFGKHSKFGAGSEFGDNNAFGAYSKFGAGARLGNTENVGRGSEFGEGDIIGKNNMFGREVKFAPRVSLGKGNVYGFETEFGKRDQVGAFGEIGRGSLVGRDVQWGKEQQFGPEMVFHPDQNLQGADQFGARDYGVDEARLPESDKAAWQAMLNASKGFEAPRTDIQKTFALASGKQQLLAESPLVHEPYAVQTDRGAVIESVEEASREAQAVKMSLQRLERKIAGAHGN